MDSMDRVDIVDAELRDGGETQAGKLDAMREECRRDSKEVGARWALARFCAPWVSNAGEKEKNALPRERVALRLSALATANWGRPAAKPFFSFSPGN